MNSLPPLLCLVPREGVRGSLSDGDRGGVVGDVGPEPAGLNVKFGSKLAVCLVLPKGGTDPSERFRSARLWFRVFQAGSWDDPSPDGRAGNTKSGFGNSSTGPVFSMV